MFKRLALTIGLLAIASAVVAAPASARPRVNVQPSTVLPGDPVLVKGRGFPARARVVVMVDAEGGRSVATRADRRGRFEKPLTVPAEAPEGRYRLVACTRRCRARATDRIRVSDTGFTRWIRRGRIVAGSSAAGIELGMPRSEVLERLGRPFFSNIPGYMQYTPDTLLNIFDVYTEGRALDAPVKQISVSFGRFRMDGVSVFRRGALRALAERYGDRLERIRVESGEEIYRLTTPTASGETYTDLLLDRQDTGLDARILNVVLIDPS